MRLSPSLRAWSLTCRQARAATTTAARSRTPPRPSLVLSRLQKMDPQTAAEQHRTACSGCTNAACASRRAAESAAPRRTTAYVALGSNLGDRVAMIEQACKEMDARGIKVRRTSSLWETEPMYVLDQDRFVNGACEVRPITNAVPRRVRGPALKRKPRRSRRSWSPSPSWTSCRT